MPLAGRPARQARADVQVVESIAAVGRAAWTELTSRASASVFYSYDFLASIERHPLSRPSSPFYLLSYEPDGTLCAALVLYLTHAVDPFAAPGTGPARMLVGHLWHCYDTELICAAPPRHEVVAGLVAAMESLADELAAGPRGLVNVNLASPLAARLAAAGLRGETTTPRYRLPVPAAGLTLDAHLTAVGRSSRRSLRQYARRAERAGTRIRFEEGRRCLDDSVLGLCTATADKHAPGYYPSAELSELIGRLGPACRILRVELDGTLLATSICLLDAHRAHFWAGGSLYPAEFNWSPQYVLFAAEFRAGLASGRQTIEFGRRNDEFKTRYGLRPVRLGRFVTTGRAP